MSSYKDTFLNLLVKTQFVEEKDEREYDYEGDMAKSQLKSIITNAQRLHDMLEDDTNLPEWVQSKITLAEDYVLTAANYMEGEEDLDEEVEQTHEAVRIVDIEKKGKLPKKQDVRDRLAQAAKERRKITGEPGVKGFNKDIGFSPTKHMDTSYVRAMKKEELELDEAQKKLKPYHWRAEWRLGTETDVDKNNKKIFDKLAKTDPVKASAFHDNLMRMKKKDMKEEVEEVDEGAKDWKKAFGKVAAKNLNKDVAPVKAKVRRLEGAGLKPKVDMDTKVTARETGRAVAEAKMSAPVKFPKYFKYKKAKAADVKEEVRYFSGTTVSGKPWKFIPPGEPKMLSPEFVKDRVPTLTDKEAHEVSVVAKDQYNDVEKKFAEMSEAKAGTVPKTPREKELAAKAHPKHLITRKDVLHARGVKLGEAELREKVREKLGAPGKTMTKKAADPVVFHPMGKKKPK